MESLLYSLLEYFDMYSCNSLVLLLQHNSADMCAVNSLKIFKPPHDMASVIGTFVYYIVTSSHYKQPTPSSCTLFIHPHQWLCCNIPLQSSTISSQYPVTVWVYLPARNAAVYCKKSTKFIPPQHHAHGQYSLRY